MQSPCLWDALFEFPYLQSFGEDFSSPFQLAPMWQTLIAGEEHCKAAQVIIVKSQVIVHRQVQLPAGR